MHLAASFLFVFLLGSSFGCNGGAPPVPVQPAAAQASVAAPGPAADTLAQLRALAADFRCSDESQCHTLPLGQSPCGGPEGYLPWSSAHTDGSALRALAERYAAERRAANTASGRVGACRFTPDPGAVCRAGACRLGSPGFQVR
jgi:hypothetical protein